MDNKVIRLRPFQSMKRALDDALDDDAERLLGCLSNHVPRTDLSLLVELNWPPSLLWAAIDELTEDGHAIKYHDNVVWVARAEQSA